MFQLPNKLASTAAPWGPGVELPSDSSFHDVPYAPYSKGDKLGRMADWTAEANKDGRSDTRTRQNGRYRDQHQAYGSGFSSAFAYQHADDEASFSVVDNRASTKPKAMFGSRGGSLYKSRGRGASSVPSRGGRGGYQRFTGRGGYETGRGDGRGRGGRGRRFGWKDYDKPQRLRDASVSVKPDWSVLEEIDFARLAKLRLEADEGVDVEARGYVHYYDRSFDKVSVKPERRLQVVDRVHYNPTTTDDPVIQELSHDGAATIFATDSILSMLMCAPRSVYPWDIVIIREGNKLFFDKREGGPFDFVTVNENAADPPLETSEGVKDTINTPSALSFEATFINQNFAIQSILESSDQKYEFQHPNPFYNAAEEIEPLAPKGYRYRKFDLSTSEEEPVHLIVRSEIDAVVRQTNSKTPSFLTIRALNEFDSRAHGAGGALDWRAKLSSQRGAVIATEMKNNSCKLARWAVQSILAGADTMKLGFLSRANPRDATKHVSLGTIGYKPREFATQMNMSMSNGWGIVRSIADICLRMPEGKYVLVKDPNKSVLRLYKVPLSTFEQDDSEAYQDVEEKETN